MPGPINNIDKEITRLKEYEIKFLTEKFTIGKKQLIFFEGPDQIVFELAQIMR